MNKKNLTVVFIGALAAALPAGAGFTFDGVSGGFTHTGSTIPDIAAIPFTGTGATRTGTIVFPNYNYLGYGGPFSGALGDMDSAIDVIRAAKTAGQTALYLVLTPRGAETVDLGTGDIAGGLVLTTGTDPANVTIDGGGRTITLTGTAINHPLITVDDGVTLTLRNITLQGMSGNKASLIGVYGGGHLILETGAVITGNTNTVGNGGGVYVSGGKFTMNGGTISGNKATGGNGGGVFVRGPFIKTGGTIYGDIDRTYDLSTGGNTATGGEGHAIYADAYAGNHRWRNDTAWPWVNLSVTYDNNSIDTVLPSNAWLGP
jgi:hypothetical protein